MRRRRRKQADDSYKVNRAPDAAALVPIFALPDVKHGLDGIGITWVERDDTDADDVIATLAVGSASRDVLIMSADRDFYQLLDDRVRMLNFVMHPGKRLIGPDQVTERYRVTPKQLACYRALTGDAADNVGFRPQRGCWQRCS